MTTESKKGPGPDRAGLPVILCVDDEPEALNAFRRCFRNEPYQVFTAASPWEALVWMERLPAVDLLLADERMPGMAGSELLAAVRERHPGTARAVISGYPTEDLVRNGLEAGAGAFLYKPWDDDLLRDTVRRILLGRKKETSSAEEDDKDPFDVGGEG
jgi:DNA-binding NtrC family response regulator